MHKLLGSSTDPDKLSLTIKSIGIWLIPAIIFIGSYYGVEIAQTDLTSIVNNVAMICASVMSIYGIGRKIYNK